MNRIFLSSLIVIFIGNISCKKGEIKTLEDRLVYLEKLSKKQGDREQANVLHEKAMAHHKKKEYQKAADLWFEAANVDSSWWKPFYNLGCISSLTGKNQTAISFIKLALEVESSPTLLKYIQTDSDLNNIRKNPEFNKLILLNGFSEKELKHFIGQFYSIGTTENKNYLLISNDNTGTWEEFNSDTKKSFTWVPNKNENGEISITLTFSNPNDLPQPIQQSKISCDIPMMVKV